MHFSCKWTLGHLKGLLDFFVHHFDVGLIDCECLHGETRCLIDWDVLHFLIVIPVLIQHQEHLLGTAKCDDWEQDVATSLQNASDFLQEIQFPLLTRQVIGDAIGTLHND